MLNEKNALIILFLSKRSFLISIYKLLNCEVKCNNYSIANIQDLLNRAISLIHLACSSKLNEFTRIKLI